MTAALAPREAPANVAEMTQAQLLDWGLRLCIDLLARADMPIPKVIGDDELRARGTYRRERGHGVIRINPRRLAKPVRVPGASWSFPGWKADVTPVGVITHELGHHVRDVLKRPRRTGWSREPKVSTYEPNADESFAEAVKLFITNPALLRVGRPVRYTHLRALGLVPVVPDDGSPNAWWDTLRLRGAHPRFAGAGKLWIAGRVGRVRVAEADEHALDVAPRVEVPVR